MARFIITGEYKDKATRAARKDLKALSQETSIYGKLAKKYWGIATAAASYYAQKGLRQSITAALDDERTQRQLAFTLERVAGANETAAIAAEANIAAMSKQYGIADDQLRPALAQLVRQTGNLTSAYSGLDLALSLSVASGESLDRAVNAIGRAYMGNYKALKTLGFAVDDKLAKDKDTVAILDKLRTKYGAFAKNELKTNENQFKRIKIAAGEAAETIGISLVNAINTFVATQGGVEGVSKTFEKIATDTADLIDGLAGLAAQTGLTTQGTKRSWLLALPVIGVYLDRIRATQAETRKLATIEKVRAGTIRSLRYEEELAKKKALQDQDKAAEGTKKTLEQLMAEEAARKAGFKLTEDIDSIQTVAAAKRLEEARQYKAQVLDAAQAQFDAVKSNYDLLNAVWQTQLTAFDAFLAALKTKAAQAQIAVSYQGTGAGSAPTATNSIAAIVPAPAPAAEFLGGGGSFGTERLALGGNTNVMNVSVNAFGTQDFLSAVQQAQQEFARNGWSTSYAGS